MYKLLGVLLALLAAVGAWWGANNRTIEDPQKAVAAISAKNYPVELPEIDGAAVSDCKFQKSQGLLGDKNDVFYVEYSASPEEIGALTQRFSQTANETYSGARWAWYFAQGGRQDFADYADGKVWDGARYDWEVLAVNEDTGTVRILIANVWDSSKNQVVLDQIALFHEDVL